MVEGEPFNGMRVLPGNEPYLACRWKLGAASKVKGLRSRSEYFDTIPLELKGAEVVRLSATQATDPSNFRSECLLFWTRMFSSLASGRHAC